MTDIYAFVEAVGSDTVRCVARVYLSDAHLIGAIATNKWGREGPAGLALFDMGLDPYGLPENLSQIARAEWLRTSGTQFETYLSIDMVSHVISRYKLIYKGPDHPDLLMVEKIMQQIERGKEEPRLILWFTGVPGASST